MWAYSLPFLPGRTPTQSLRILIIGRFCSGARGRIRTWVARRRRFPAQTPEAPQPPVSQPVVVLMFPVVLEPLVVQVRRKVADRLEAVLGRYSLDVERRGPAADPA